jgi:hypothetical protein
MKKRLSRLAAVSAALALAAASAHAVAAAPDYTTLTAAVDWSTTSAAILTIGAGLMTLYILMKGVKVLHRFIKGS